jgi:N-acetylglucosaminyldiphosphoundecaprenol N-acetyl-beta-D-mannosaminyltransferase
LSSIEILGCRVDAVGREAAVQRVIALANDGAPAMVVTLGTEMVMYAQHDARFRAAIESAALSVCDTIGLLLISRLRGGPLRERVAGVELVVELAKRSRKDGLRFFLLGGRGDTSLRAASALKEYGAVIAGARDGYFASDDASAVTSEIKSSGANVLLAGLGSPKQELWLAQHLNATGCGVGIGIGGTLDVLAGNVNRAPKLWQQLGVEWLYRLVREPWRWRRQLALPLFLLLAVGETVQLYLARRGRT